MPYLNLEMYSKSIRNKGKYKVYVFYLLSARRNTNQLLVFLIRD